MKKLIFTSIVAVALICSTSVMAQNQKGGNTPANQKKEVKAEAKKEDSKTKSDAVATSPKCENGTAKCNDKKAKSESCTKKTETTKSATGKTK